MRKGNAARPRADRTLYNKCKDVVKEYKAFACFENLHEGAIL